MHEQDKLDEAQYFLDRLGQLPEPDSFRHELSAFLSAARSALQYALEEAKTKPGGQAWYNAQIAGKTLVKYFRDKRDLSIHRQPVVPITSASVTLTASVDASTALHMRVTNAKGEVVQEVSVSDAQNTPPPPTPPVVTYSYRFINWTGPEDVLALCRQYLAEVQCVVSDGVAHGHLTR
jgi:hypothetical protein